MRDHQSKVARIGHPSARVFPISLHFSAHAERQTKAAMGKDKAKKAGQASAAGARAGGFGGGGSFGGCAP